MTFELLRRAVARGHEVTWFGACSPGARLKGDGGGHPLPAARTRVDRAAARVAMATAAPGRLRRRRRPDQHAPLPHPVVPAGGEASAPDLPDRARVLVAGDTRSVSSRRPLGYLAESPTTLRAYRSTRTITISESTRLELVALGYRPSVSRSWTPAITTPALDALPDQGRGPAHNRHRAPDTGQNSVEEAVEGVARGRPRPHRWKRARHRRRRRRPATGLGSNGRTARRGLVDAVTVPWTRLRREQA